MEFLLQYGLFLAEVVTVLIAIVIVISVVASLNHRGKHEPKPELYVQRLNDSLEEQKDQLNSALMDKAEYKAFRKQQEESETGAHQSLKTRLLKKLGKKSKTETHGPLSSVQDSHLDKSEQDQEEPKKEKESKPPKKRVFLINFEGDIKASTVGELARSVTAVLLVAEPDRDEVVVNLESAGGLVHGYGLAAAQLERIRAHGVYLTVLVDRIAASGGYMMAAVANQILAAPFAIVGSIGVVAQIPNFNRLLKKHEVDLELHTAGEYKRTLTLFGENTPEGRTKFKHELEETHQLFKGHLEAYRPVLDLEKVATGEHWYGKQAKSFNLVDDLVTSEAYLVQAAKEADVFEVSFEAKKSVADKLLHLFQMGLQSGFAQFLRKSDPAAAALMPVNQESTPFSCIRLQADVTQYSNERV